MEFSPNCATSASATTPKRNWNNGYGPWVHTATLGTRSILATTSGRKWGRIGRKQKMDNLLIFRNILRAGGPAHVTTFLPYSPQRDHIRTALELLARLQTFAAAELLDNAKIHDFRTTAEQFREHMLLYFRTHCTTTKFHHLVYHAPQFAATHGFWGLLSEQPMEHFHADFNNAMARKENTKNIADILTFCARESLLRNAIFDSGEI